MLTTKVLKKLIRKNKKNNNKKNKPKYAHTALLVPVWRVLSSALVLDQCTYGFEDVVDILFDPMDTGRVFPRSQPWYYMAAEKYYERTTDVVRDQCGANAISFVDTVLFVELNMYD